MAPAQKTGRNYALEFWRVFFTLAICYMHLHTRGFYSGPGFLSAAFPNGTNNFFWRGGFSLEIFLLIGGYFMVDSF